LLKEFTVTGKFQDVAVTATITTDPDVTMMINFDTMVL